MATASCFSEQEFVYMIWMVMEVTTMESSSRNYDVLGRELFTPDEVRKLDNKKCIIFNHRSQMLHWSYTPEQKEEVKKALAAGVPKATILTYFYPEVSVERMSSYRKKH